jgi:hypothetical protein
MSYRVKNWTTHQHYSKRRPPWIKLYTNCIEEFTEKGEESTFFRLTSDEKLALMLAWLLASHFGGKLPDKPESWYCMRLGIDRFPLQRLVASGLIEYDGDASTVASTVASSTEAHTLAPETEGEGDGNREKDIPLTGGSLGHLRSSEDKSASFNEFWNAYPKKVSKKPAFKAWLKAKDKPDLHVILSKLAVQARSENWIKDGGKYIPYPATWINEGRWEDEDPKNVFSSTQKQTLLLDLRTFTCPRCGKKGTDKDAIPAHFVGYDDPKDYGKQCCPCYMDPNSGEFNATSGKYTSAQIVELV